jgi:RNA polymerase sigma-70 factor (ECF subfamily)
MRLDVSDAELVAALTAGRPEAFRTAWQRFSPVVGGVLRHALGPDELEDVVQEVFSCLFRRVSTLRDPHALRPFVLAITFNTVKYERRRRRRRARVSLIADPAELNLAGREQPASNLAFVRFVALLRRLAERERTTFVYRFIEGMTVAQVATALNVSEPTARRSFSRAFARMQKWAEKDPFLNDYLQRRTLELPWQDQALDDEGFDGSAADGSVADGSAADGSELERKTALPSAARLHRKKAVAPGFVDGFVGSAHCHL